MAVALDASSEAHTGTTGSASELSFTWDHGGAASGVRGVLVYVWNNADANNATSVTYGGVTVPAVSGGEAADTAGEPGRCTAYFLSQSIPQGTQAVVVNRTNNATVMSATAITVTAAQPVRVVPGSIVLTTGDAAVAEVSVTDAVGGMTGVASLRCAAGHFGHQTPPAAGASSTRVQLLDIGSQCFVTFVETTPGTGARSVGGSNATTDDRAIVSLAIAEVYEPAVAPLVLTGLALTVLVALTMDVPAGPVALTGLAPTVLIESGVTLPIPAGTMPLTGYALAVREGILRELPAGSLPLTSEALILSVAEAIGIAVPAGGAGFTGLVPQPSLGLFLDVPAGALTHTGAVLTVDDAAPDGPDMAETLTNADITTALAQWIASKGVTISGNVRDTNAVCRNVLKGTGGYNVATTDYTTLLTRFIRTRSAP